MKIVRDKVFETNSSSTHSLVYSNGHNNNYLSPSSTLVVEFINTDDVRTLTSLKEKVSYLVSQIINQYKWDVYDYEDLKEQVERNHDYQHICSYVMERFGKKVTLPKSYDVRTWEDGDGDTYSNLDEIVNINHQICCSNLDELLTDLVVERHDLLDDVLNENTIIEFGRD